MTLRAFPKPCELEGIETKTAKQKRATRTTLFIQQGALCGCGCGRRMTLEADRMDSCTLDHQKPNKAGCRKQDADWNLKAYRWDCNFKKGSRRGVVTNEGK